MNYDLKELARRLRDPEQYVDACDEAAAALDYLRSLPEPVDGWRPIETAPKDGTEILAITDLNVIHVAWWALGEWRSNRPWILVGPDFTDWQPLPPPPAEDTQPPQTQEDEQGWPIISNHDLDTMDGYTDTSQPCPNCGISTELSIVLQRQKEKRLDDTQEEAQ